MITLECSVCNNKYLLDEDDDDEIQNAFIEGWEFSLHLDTETFCPRCQNGRELRDLEDL